eukprot:TRINITY_DN63563_c0_g1_i1.p1 TRINITY_DN63563_c0_g1~~TRINITY_DN63563_c0_g1_i1.p1  ORF type:complete len:288 (+),score=41.91 TRINITY_DN63563_c0_g1_i1:183-1046(+)
MRVLGLGGWSVSALEADLRRMTEADLIDVPAKDVLLCIAQSSHDANDRREIMGHLNDCLKDVSSEHWRRIHGALVLLDHLLKNGSPALVEEAAEGHHFDVVQRLTFLEKFRCPSDVRVQDIVQKKAAKLRSEMLARTQRIDTDDFQEGPGAPLAMSSGLWESRTKSPAMVVNGIALVGHRENTSSESGSDAELAAAPGRGRGRGSGRGASGRRQGRIPAPQDQRRRVMEESTDSDSSSSPRRRESEQAGNSSVRRKSGKVVTPQQAPVENSTVRTEAVVAPADLLDL